MLRHLYVGDPDDGLSGAADLLDIRTFGTIKITGLGRPVADLSSFAYAGIDASHVSGMSIPSRTITMEVDTQNEYQRMRLYRVMPFRKLLRFWIVNDTGTYWIDGYAKELPYDEIGHDISSFEIPVFCPYPWFRSKRLHEKEITIGATELIHLKQSGDAPAGILVYAQGSLSNLGRITSFRLESGTGDYFTASVNFVSSIIIPGIHRNLLVDTTPNGNLGTSGKFDAEYLASIDMSDDLITVEPDTGVDVTLDVSSVVSDMTVYQFFACWYDTFTAI